MKHTATTTTTRRKFISTTAGAFAGINILPSHVWAQSPNQKLNLAHIGVGGMGGSDHDSLRSHKMVHYAAICDVDSNNLARAKAKSPDAETFRDYRELLAKMGNKIDAVCVSTPDHTHAPASVSAMNLGKHVYCQKPLTHEVFEARQARLLSEKKNLSTQMGIQIHAHPFYRMATQMIQEGRIGKVSTVHAWSNKDWGYDGPDFEGEDKVPDYLNWDAWIGSAAMRPFKNGVYHPANWRKIIDFGTGTLGDMGVHIFDTPFRALELTGPKWVKTTCRKPGGPGHPSKNKVEYAFPGTKHTTEELIWIWTDGAFAPPQDVKVPDNTELPGQGSLFIGEKGMLLLPHIGPPRLLPAANFEKEKRPKLEEIDHYHQWVDACLGKGKASANFTYAGKLTEALLLGVVANRFPEQKLEWDFENMKVTNIPEANKLLKRTYRKGYEVEGLSGSASVG